METGDLLDEVDRSIDIDPSRRNGDRKRVAPVDGEPKRFQDPLTWPLTFLS